MNTTRSEKKFFTAFKAIDVYTLAKQMGTSVKMIELHYGHLQPEQKSNVIAGKHMSSKETAEAILIVIKKILMKTLKWVFIITLFSVVLLFVGTKIEELWEWQKYGKHAEKVTIKFVTLLDDKECSKDYPYMYVITNESSKVVKETRFSVEIRRVGYSNVINSHTDITDSKILKPTEISTSCFRATTTGYKSEVIREKDVDYSVDYKRVQFEK